MFAYAPAAAFADADRLLDTIGGFYVGPASVVGLKVSQRSLSRATSAGNSASDVSAYSELTDSASG